MDSSKLLGVVESSHAIRTMAEFKTWITGPVRDYFPHEMMLCALGNVRGEEVRIRHLIGVGYPEECVMRFSRITSLKERRVLQRWRTEYRAQLIDMETAPAQLSDMEFEEFTRLDLQNLAVFGCMDITGEGGSYFSFSRIPGELTQRHAYQLELLVPHLHQTLIRLLHRHGGEFDAPVGTAIPLTERERQILHLMATGMSNRAIAQMLSRSELTVQNHVHAILRKMGVPNRAAAVASMTGRRWGRDLPARVHS